MTYCLTIFISLSKDLFLKLVKVEARERYAAETALQHPWVTGKHEDEIPLTSYERMELYDQKQNFGKVSYSYCNREVTTSRCSRRSTSHATLHTPQTLVNHLRGSCLHSTKY